MSLTISKIKFEEKEILKPFLFQYLKELNEDTDYPYLDSYWEDDKRLPFKLTLNKKWLGIALINDYTIIECNTIAIAEFYILPNYRNQGLGKYFAKEIFKTCSGQWEVRFQKVILTGGKFWRKIISKLYRI